MDILSTSSQVVDLGRMDYEPVRKIQLELVRRRKESDIGNFLIFVEHNPVYTIGRKADPANFKGINPLRTERGGDVTYHGPGQLVTYIVMDIRRDGRLDVRGFVNAVTENFISAIRSFGFDAHGGVSEPGIWVGRNQSRKVGSIGMAIDQWVSYHGVAVNISKETVDPFRAIRPCGMDPEVMSYIPVERTELMKRLTNQFENMMGKLIPVDKNHLLSVLDLSPDLPDSLLDAKSLVGDDSLHKEER
ncbi:MAG: lipoyl(octanoyl) transferase LipB [Thermoplasmata archaeon]